MRPFDGKATRRILDDKLNPDGRQLRRFEREGTVVLTQAFGRLKADLFRGINNENVHELIVRLDKSDVTQPFHDTMLEIVQEWALAGADFGREQVEREILGTI